MDKKTVNTILINLLKVIQNSLNEFIQEKNIVELHIDNEKLETTEVSDESTLALIDTLTKQLQALRAEYNLEAPNHVSDHPQKRMKFDDTLQQITAIEHRVGKEDSKNEPADVDWSLVQVKAEKSEIDRRISAFIQQKQNEVDLVNKREFCNILDTSQENVSSCARTDAIFVPRFGQKSHIKVTRVGNTSTSDEAQALGHVTDNRRQSGQPNVSCAVPSVTERLRNIKHHLGFAPGKPVALDIYEQLQNLENRILYLESLSPEYFNQNASYFGGKSLSQTTSSAPLECLSLSAIDERITTLKNSLLNRSR